MIDINWEDPPAQKRGPGGGSGNKYAAMRELLTQNPGRWAILTHNANPIRASRLATYHKQSGRWDGYEIVSREGTIYVRFLGRDVDGRTS